MDSMNISASELSIWALANLWNEDKEGAYAIRHGWHPVSDFGRPHQGEGSADPDHENFFAKAFPCLFPYGCGGVEADQPCSLSFTEHIRWLLQYHDHCFRVHDTFPYVAFGIEQRHQVLNSARLQMRCKTFDKDAQVLSRITIEQLHAAQKEEEHGLPISNPSVRLLRQHVHATGSRVIGSDQSRYSLRGQMWATSICLSPPSLWITINPTNLHD